MVGGLIFVLLFSAISFAVVQAEESFDYDDISLMGGDAVTQSLGYFALGSLLLGLELRVLVIIMRLEYLRGHIGEKRFASRAIRTNNLSLFERLLKTALFYSAVFSIFSAPFVDDVNRLIKVFRSILIYPVSSK